MLRLSFLNIISNDLAQPWQLGFQDVASPAFTGIVDLHNTIFFYLVIISIGVFWLLSTIIYFYKSSTSLLIHKYLNHGTLIELIWTISPALILIAIAFPSFRLLYLLDEVTSPTITIKVTGHQWYWSYEYSDYLTEKGESIEYDSYMIPESDLELGQFRLLDVDQKVIIPVDTHTRLIVSSADVLHDYAVPSLGVKLDAVPGRLNQSSMYAEREGVFYGQCSEICGVYHGFMPTVVEAVTAEKYLSWLDKDMSIILYILYNINYKRSYERTRKQVKPFVLRILGTLKSLRRLNTKDRTVCLKVNLVSNIHTYTLRKFKIYREGFIVCTSVREGIRTRVRRLFTFLESSLSKSFLYIKKCKFFVVSIGKSIKKSFLMPHMADISVLRGPFYKVSVHETGQLGKTPRSKVTLSNIDTRARVDTSRRVYFILFLFLGIVSTLLFRFRISTGFSLEVQIVLSIISITYVSVITTFILLKLIYVRTYYTLIKFEYAVKNLSKFEIGVYYSVFFTYVIVSTYFVSTYLLSFSEYYFVDIYILSSVVLFTTATFLFIILFYNKKNKSHVSLNLLSISTVTTQKALVVIGLRVWGILMILICYCYFLGTSIYCQPDAEEIIKEDHTITENNSSISPSYGRNINIDVRPETFVDTHVSNKNSEHLRIRSTSLHNLEKSPRFKESSSSMNTRMISILREVYTHFGTAIKSNVGAGNVTEHTLSLKSNNIELLTKEKMDSTKNTLELENINTSCAEERTDRTYDVNTTAVLEKFSALDIVCSSLREGRFPQNTELYLLNPYELRTHVRLPLEFNIPDTDLKNLINTDLDIASASLLIQQHNFIRNVYEFSHIRNMPDQFYTHLCTELVRNAMLQTPENDMQNTLLSIWLLNPTDTGIKNKFIYFNDTYSCLVDAELGKSHNLVFPVTDIFRYENPFFFYHKIRNMSEVTETCFVILKKQTILSMIRSQYPNIFFDMECGLQENDTPLAQNWGSQIKKFYTPYYISQDNVIIIKVLFNRDKAFLAIPGNSPDDLLVLLEGIFSEKMEAVTELSKAKPRIHPQTISIVDEKLISLYKTHIKDVIKF